MRSFSRTCISLLPLSVYIGKNSRKERKEGRKEGRKKFKGVVTNDIRKKYQNLEKDLLN